MALDCHISFCLKFFFCILQGIALFFFLDFNLLAWNVYISRWILCDLFPQMAQHNSYAVVDGRLYTSFYLKSWLLGNFNLVLWLFRCFYCMFYELHTKLFQMAFSQDQKKNLKKINETLSEDVKISGFSVILRPSCCMSSDTTENVFLNLF